MKKNQRHLPAKDSAVEGGGRERAGRHSDKKYSFAER